MADGKIRYDLDFDVHTESVSRALSEAINKVIGGIRTSTVSNNAAINAYDAAIAGLGQRTGIDSLREGAAFNMGLPDFPETKNSFGRFASMAAASPYGYKPSTVQAMLRSAVASELKLYETAPDLKYKMDIERITNKLRAQQKENRASDLALVYAQQGEAFANAAANASSPEEQRILLSRAASRYGSIASRTLMEAGAVSPESAGNALSVSAQLSSIRSGIKTSAQIAAQKDKEYDLIATSAELQDAQENAAWAARDKELAYSPSQKAREMEKGFRAMEAMSATEDIYNLGQDPDYIRWGYGNALHAAAQYVSDAEKMAPGSAGREAKLQLAKESMRGITVSGMAKSGMGRDELDRNTTALIGLTNLIKELSGEGKGGDGGGSNWLTSGLIGKIYSTALKTTIDVMEGRTRWLSDMSNPYQTRRDVRQGWAQNYGIGAGVLGAGLALTGTGVGAAVGIPLMIGGAVSSLVGTHYKDEKKIGLAIQDRMVEMNTYRNLYRGSEYNYAQMVSGLGYGSTESNLELNRAADMLPGAMMFGAVSEQQMMALSYMPNYWAGLMEGRSTSELMALYKNDIEALPREMRQYITSLLPGVSEDTRAFVSSPSYDVATGFAGAMHVYDEYQYGKAPMWLRGKQYQAVENMRWVNRNIADESLTASAPNAFRNEAEWRQYMAETRGDAWLYSNALGTRDFYEPVGSTRMREIDNGAPLGNIIINIGDREAYNEPYRVTDFENSTQTYIIGGV